MRWRFKLEPRTPGAYTLRARATDESGRVQPVSIPFNSLGYLFGAVVEHPVTVACARRP